jgi:acyl phosphate:glycerol-3-phosphate acyltransferase
VSLLTIAILGVSGYVLGSLPWGYWLSRFFTGKDIRQVGSRGTGAANVWRHAGFKMFFAVALLDIGKGSAAAALGLAVGGSSGAVVAGSGALVGHWRPLFLGFRRGGKIVATTVGVALVIAPLASVVMAVVWWMVLLTTRYTSVASIAASLSLPPLVFAFGGSWPEVLFTVGAAAAIIMLHLPNIARLLAGTENRITLRLPGVRRQSPAPVAATAAADRTPRAR